MRALYVHLGAFLLITAWASAPAVAQTPPCRPCAGVRVTDFDSAIRALDAAPSLGDEERLYLAWETALDGSADTARFERARQAGATPWIVARFAAPNPLRENAEILDAELRDLARIARAAGPRAHIQLDWRGAGAATPDDVAFWIKRAAVTVTGAHPEARVIVGPLLPNPARLRALYAQEVAAYVDGIALAPGDPVFLGAAVDALAEVDPGKPVVLDGARWPDDPRHTLVTAAAMTERGFSVTVFERDAPNAEDLLPLKVLAREFRGDLSLDPYSKPSIDGAVGTGRTWSFVRGEDLALRVIAEISTNDELVFTDTQLRRPEVVSLETGEAGPAFGQHRTDAGLAVPIETGPVALVRLERASAAELEGVAEEVEVAGERQIPVEEILRRLQAFEDGQARKLRHYQARNTMHLRFQLGSGVETIEASYAGRFFFERDQGFDWAWDDFFFNGVRWRGDKPPEIPLIQPEKAAALPLEILFTKEYDYRLRGTAQVAGRDCWVIDFQPLAVETGRSLYQGTVWVDREIHARVQTRALQLGLEGDVLSNEETVYFTPVDAEGQAAPWSAESYVLPTRVVSNQLLSLLNTATQLEQETILTDLRLNGSDFADAREAVRSSDATMVRDTEAGLRYLVQGEDGARVVQETFDTDRLFVAGGVFYDDSVDFPVPLAGVNYLSLDFRDTGNQVNALFAGPLLTANLADPSFLGSRWDAGINVFGFFLATGNEQFRGGVENPAEEIENRRARVAMFLGHPLGNYTKLDLTYAARWDDYGRASDTADDLVLPQDTLTHTFQTELTYTRNGWRGRLAGSLNRRDDWAFWGLPGNTEFDLEQEEYTRWSVSLAKTWWLPKFTKLGVEVEHLNGSDLDRFSKFDFGLFGDADVAGYPNGLVRAEEADGLHVTYGLNLGEVFRVEVVGDAVWATDEVSGLDRELLAGIGFEGTLMGPWRTIVNFEIGFAVDGPSDDFAARIVFLKLLGNKKNRKK